MYRSAEYLHFPEIAIAALLERFRAPLPERKLSFGPDGHQVAYYIQPRHGRENPEKPLLIYIHGGGWRRGHPRFFRFVGRFFARLGYTVLLPGYRLGPTHQFDEQLADIRRGIDAYLKLPSVRSRPPTTAVIIGQSAGGHLGAHIAFAGLTGTGTGNATAPDRRTATREGEVDAGRPDSVFGISPRPVGFISISGVLSFEPAGWRYLEGLIKNTAATEELRSRSDARSVLSRRSGEVATLLIHGREDRIVPEPVSREFEEAYLAATGRRLAFLSLPWAKHNELGLLFLNRRPRPTALMLQWIGALEEQNGTG